MASIYPHDRPNAAENMALSQTPGQARGKQRLGAQRLQEPPNGSGHPVFQRVRGQPMADGHFPQLWNAAAKSGQIGDCEIVAGIHAKSCGNRCIRRFA